MEVEPSTENGKQLVSVLTEWMKKSGQEGVKSILKRALFMYAPKIMNEDAFNSAIYGQGVVDETPLELKRQLTTSILRIQYAIETSLKTGHVKELIVALEWSDNDEVVNESLKWARKAALEDPAEFRNSDALDLAPQKAARRFSSLMISGKAADSFQRREREIACELESKDLSVLEVCGNQILVGFRTGRIEIYNSLDLQCELSLPYVSDDAPSVTCLQCTCSELIVGYSDGNICLWNTQTGALIQKFSVRNGYAKGYAKCMKWRRPKLVIAVDQPGTGVGRVGVWQLISSELSLLSNWPVLDDTDIQKIEQIDFDMSHVIIVAPYTSSPVRFYYFNGKSEYSSVSLCGQWNQKLHGNGSSLVSVDRLSSCVRIWDIYSYPKHVAELVGHKGRMNIVDAHQDFILTGDDNGEIIIWSLEAALEGKSAEIVRFSSAALRYWNQCVRLGRNFLAWFDRGSSRVKVVDFL